MTSFIQSRGRARKVDSQFIVFGTVDEMDKFLNIEQQELNMINSVRNQVQIQTLPVEEQIICDRLNLAEPRISIIWCQRDIVIRKVLKNNLILEFIKLVPFGLISNFDCVDAWKQMENYLKTKEIKFSDITWSESKEKFTLTLDVPDDSDCFVYYDRFLDLFMDHEILSVINPLTMYIKNRINGSLNTDFSLLVKDLAFGYFWNEQVEFRAFQSEELSVFKSGRLFADPDSLYMKIANGDNTLSFDLDLLDSDIYIGYPQEKSISVIIPLKRMPFYYKKKSDGIIVRVPINRGMKPFTLVLEIDASNAVDLKKLVAFIHSKFVNIVFSSIYVNKISDVKEHDHHLKNYFKEMDSTEDVKMDMYSFLSQNPLISPIEFVESLKKSSTSFSSLNYFHLKKLENITFNSHIDAIVSGLSESTSNTLHYISKKDNYIQMRRVLITPSRIILTQKMLIQSNRILRNHKTEDFCLVQFIDDDFQRLDTGEVQLLEHAGKIMKNGFDILIPNGHFYFVGCSNSQFRECRAWFTRDSVERIHSWIGDIYSGSRCVGKIIKRLGLPFSSSWPSIDLELNEISNEYSIEDILSESLCNMSDGIGLISQKLAEQIVPFLPDKLQHVPSAFQIRIGGIKGVLSVCPESFMRGRRVLFR